jgi:hypothetical protein
MSEYSGGSTEPLISIYYFYLDMFPVCRVLWCLSAAPPPINSTKFKCYMLMEGKGNDTYDHRTLKIDLPVRSAVFRGTVLGELSCARSDFRVFLDSLKSVSPA